MNQKPTTTLIILDGWVSIPIRGETQSLRLIPRPGTICSTVIPIAASPTRECCITFSAEALFDVQVKRIHEYKRQLLNLLHVVHLYDRIKRGDTEDLIPRCVLISGKAAPGYHAAKQIVALINHVAHVVNNDPDVGGLLGLAFIPNYNISVMELICPAADLSAQISTAGKEASGTGNMKFMMNGAITIGTLGGANIEILEEVGEDNFFLFGMTAEQVEGARTNYDPDALIDADPDLQSVMERLESGSLLGSSVQVFHSVFQSIRNPADPWLTAADFRSFVDAQNAVSLAYMDSQRWTKMSIANTVAAGKFSSDRTIREYNTEIWQLTQPTRGVNSSPLQSEVTLEYSGVPS